MTHICQTVFWKICGAQVDIGINAAKISGGRYENFNGTNRLATLLPDIARQIAQSVALQNHQYRVSYDRPGKPNEKGAAISAYVGVKLGGR